MGTTAVYGFRYPELGDAPDGPKLGRELAQDVEGALQGNLTLGGNLTVPGTLTVGGTIPSLTVSGAVTIAGITVASRPRGIIAGYARPTQKAATTGEHGQLRIDNISVLSGRAYRFYTCPLNLDGAAIDIFIAQLRYSTAGSATTASTVMPGSYAAMRQADPNSAEAVTVDTVYQPGSNQTLSVILTEAGVVFGTACTVQVGAGEGCALYVEDIGAAITLTGTAL